MPRISKVKLPNNTVADIYGKSIVLTYGQKPTEAQVNDLVEVFSGSANTPTFINYTVGGNVDVMVPATIQGDDGTYINVSGVYADDDNCAYRLRVQLTPLYPYSEVEADWVKESLDGAHVFLPGDGDYSGVQKHGESLMGIDATSSALTSSSLVENAGNIAGVKGYHWSSVNINTKTFTFDTAVTGWATGDTISTLASGSRHVNFGKITAISGTNVTVDTLPFSSVTTSSVYGNQVACVMDKPDCGDFDLGIAAHAEGFQTTATNKFAHSEGYLTHAIGEMAHAEGQGTTAIYTAHAEGRDTTASGNYAHSEGRLSTASGAISHAEGYSTEATSGSSHAEGNGSKTTGQQAHAEGYLTLASGAGAHAEGSWTIASGRNAHAESGNWVGYIYPVGAANAVSYTAAIDSDNQAEIEKFGATVFCDIMKTSFINVGTKVVRFTSFTISGNSFTFTVERTLSATALDGTTAFVASTSNAYGPESHAETGARASYGSRSHAEGRGSISIGYNSHVEGHESIGRGEDSHAEGYNTETGGIDDYSANTKTAGTTSTIVQTDKKGGFAHAEGNSTIAFGLASHSEGTLTFAKGESSHAEGISTITKNKGEHAEGQFNVSNKASDTFGNSGNTHTSIGIGTSDTGRTNAVEIMENGDAYLKGVGGYRGTTITGAKTLQQVISDSQPMIVTSWYSLKQLRDNGKLIPGMQYRITDYVCSNSRPGIVSAAHQFDIIVVADSNSTLNEEARATFNSFDTYFSQAGANLEAWQIWYCLDNDADRFSWAYEYGKGVIYRMIDEWGNDCPYDFKSIMFPVAKIVDCPSVPSLIGKYASPYSSGDIVVSGTTYWCYTFSMINPSAGTVDDVSVFQTKYPPSAQNQGFTLNNVIKSSCYNSGNKIYYYICNNVFVTDTTLSERLSGFCNNTIDSSSMENYFSDGCLYNSLGKDCNHNIFGSECSGNILKNYCYGNRFGTHCLNNTLGYSSNYNILSIFCSNNIIGDGSYNNILKQSVGKNKIGSNCSNNTIGNNSDNNIFGNDCSNNSLGNNCLRNSFGNYCYNNSFGNSCNSNSFGNECYDNSFGYSCNGNSFGNECYDNSFGYSCNGNSFGNNCFSNTFGNNCASNSLGNSCNNNSFGSDCTNNSFENRCQINVFGDYCPNNIFGNNCFSNNFGSYCQSNIFGNNCYGNSFGISCHNNSFGNDCYDNSFGISCRHNSFGNECYHIKFATDGGNVLSYYRNIIVENGNRFINLYCTSTTSDISPYRNVKIAQGVNNTSTTKTIYDSNVNHDYQTVYQPANSQIISV